MAKKKKKGSARAKVPDSYMLSCRFPPDKLPDLDRYVSRLQQEHPGPRWTRSSAALNAILKKLDEEAAR